MSKNESESSRFKKCEKESFFTATQVQDVSKKLSLSFEREHRYPDWLCLNCLHLELYVTEEMPRIVKPGRVENVMLCRQGNRFSQ